jgi:ADP-ribose pyrophosphatase YjhB (NUDIX family)
VNGKEFFVFPGGKKEPNETLEEAVVREAKEETSVEVKLEKYFHSFVDDNNDTSFYLCSYISGEPKLGEGNELRVSNMTNQYIPMWKQISELPDLIIRPQELKELLLRHTGRSVS